MKTKVQVLVLCGDGINCEEETAAAFINEGADAQIVHISELIENPSLLKNVQILALPGGFSFGDELGSGQVLALKLRYSLGLALQEFIESKKLVIGICNGFQALVRLGLLPRPFQPRTMALAHNKQGHFINRWVDLKIPRSKCVWTKTLEDKEIKLPIRHGEGRVVFSGDENTQAHIFETLHSNGQIALYYSEDINGSYQKIAGVCDPTGLILGLMPHPEAATSNLLFPGGAEKKEGIPWSRHLFKNGIEYCQNNFF